MRHPLMQPYDAVKLIYQNEFGGGHLIRDEQACLNYLRREYADLEKDSTVPLYEDIGNGIVRVKLAAVKPEDMEQLGHDFIASAANHKGTLDSFLNKLGVLHKLTTAGVFSYDLDAPNAYMSEYKAAGYSFPNSRSKLAEIYYKNERKWMTQENLFCYYWNHISKRSLRTKKRNMIKS